MSELIHQFINQQALLTPDADALYFKDQTLSYAELDQHVQATAQSFASLGLAAGERVAIYLPKQLETVFSLFGASRAGGVFVPINPLLKPQQVAYILKDCNVRILVTSNQRLSLLNNVLPACHDLNTVIVVDSSANSDQSIGAKVLDWEAFQQPASLNKPCLTRIDADMAAILYTSGSTGNPKGVVLSHRNMVIGAKSVASYLKNTSKDKLLAVLPFSFDYGLSQLTTAFSTGASVALMDYLLPRDILRAVVRYQITGLAGVPPIWNQLVQLDWPKEACRLRYITNSGGAMPKATTTGLQSYLPNTDFYLMYGLTEAFRSTYLPPDQVAIRPDSMGKAIPNAEVMVLREDGSECAPGEPGELVHRGSLVSLGYWNDPVKTAERFKPIPAKEEGLPLPELAVWSGDQVKKDDEGYFYFISRKDEMIKTSGYRVSPTEIEEVVYSLQSVSEVAAIGLPHPSLGQAILLLAIGDSSLTDSGILTHCKKELPNFMVPQAVIILDQLPHNQNGKIDRKQLSSAYQNQFQEPSP